MRHLRRIESNNRRRSSCPQTRQCRLCRLQNLGNANLTPCGKTGLIRVVGSLNCQNLP